MKKNSGGAMVLIAKLGPKLLSLAGKFLKFAKFGKIALAGASVASYAMLFTWQFALVIVGSVFFHECGHYWAMKKSGVKTKGIYLLPFIGGAAVAEESFKSRGNESFIALMGPVFGLGLAAITFGIYLLTKNPFAAAIAGWMALINAFNLLPIEPLDGGRLVKSVTFSINSSLGMVFMLIGTAFGIYLAVKFHIFIFAFLLAIGIMEMLGEYRNTLDKKIEMRVAKIMKDPELESSKIDDMPRMNAKGVAGSILGYLSLGSLFISIMFAVSHIPGAAVALEVLVDAPSKNASSASHLSPFVIVMAVISLAGLGFLLYVISKLIKNVLGSLSTLRKLDVVENDPELSEKLSTSLHSAREKILKAAF